MIYTSYKYLLHATCVIAVVYAGSAHGQDSNPAAQQTQDWAYTDIVVTAQKRDERLSDVPIAISAATGDQLARQGVTSVEGLDRIAPGFTFQQSHFGTPVFTIRGVGFFDSSIGGSPAVSVYLDQVPLPYSLMTRGVALDLERVEVLKGPQGTLFGQSSTGGAINYIAAKPTEDMRAGFTLNAGRFDEVSTEAFVSGKLAEGLTARVAGRYEYRDGWQKPDMRNDARFGQSENARLGRRRFYTGRILLDWKPTDTFRFELGANGWHDGSEPQAFHYIAFAPTAPMNPLNAGNSYANLGPLTATPKDPRLAGWDPNTPFGLDDDFYQVSLRGDVDLSDSITLSSISAYSKLTTNAYTDTDGTAYAAFVLRRQGSIKSFSQELRVAGTSGAVDWMIGGNYAWDHSTEIQQNLLKTSNAGLGPFPFSGLEVRNDQQVHTYAAFGSLDYALSPKFELQLSARYTKQDRDFRGCLADPGNGQVATAFGAVFGFAATAGECITQSAPGVLLGEVHSSLNEDNISFRGGVNWKPSDDALIYVSVSRGYKPGSYSVLPGVFASQFSPVTQESVTSYEAGFKLSALDRRISLDGAVFYADYTDKQILGSAVIPPFGNLPKLVNIPRSRIYGGELQAVVRPFAGLRTTAGIAYYNSRVLDDPSNPVDAYGVPTSFVGEELPTSPRWQIVGDAEYGFSVSTRARMFVGGGLTYHSSTYSVFGENPGLLLPAYALIDARGGIEAEDGSWRVQLWGKNVTNKFYYLSTSVGGDRLAGLTGMPATYGVTLSFRY